MVSPDLVLIFSFIMHSIRLGAWPASRQRGVRRAVVAAVALAAIVVMAASLSVVQAAAQERRPNCENFLDEDDAQVVFSADPGDPFGLDGSGEHNGKACEYEDAFGSAPLVDCNDLKDHPEIAGALHEHSIKKYGEDRYGLSPCAIPEAQDAPLTGSDAPTSEAPSIGMAVSSSFTHPYVAYMAEGGVPIGAHTLGLVTRGQAAVGASDGQQASTAQAAADESPRERKASRRKAKRDKKAGKEGQHGQPKRTRLRR